MVKYYSPSTIPRWYVHIRYRVTSKVLLHKNNFCLTTLSWLNIRRALKRLISSSTPHCNDLEMFLVASQTLLAAYPFTITLHTQCLYLCCFLLFQEYYINSNIRTFLYINYTPVSSHTYRHTFLRVLYDVRLLRSFLQRSGISILELLTCSRMETSLPETVRWRRGEDFL